MTYGQLAYSEWRASMRAASGEEFISWGLAPRGRARSLGTCRLVGRALRAENRQDADWRIIGGEVNGPGCRCASGHCNSTFNMCGVKRGNVCLCECAPCGERMSGRHSPDRHDVQSESDPDDDGRVVSGASRWMRRTSWLLSRPDRLRDPRWSTDPNVRHDLEQIVFAAKRLHDLTGARAHDLDEKSVPGSGRRRDRDEVRWVSCAACGISNAGEVSVRRPRVLGEHSRPNLPDV